MSKGGTRILQTGAMQFSWSSDDLTTELSYTTTDPEDWEVALITALTGLRLVEFRALEPGPLSVLSSGARAWSLQRVGYGPSVRGRHDKVTRKQGERA